MIFPQQNLIGGMLQFTGVTFPWKGLLLWWEDIQGINNAGENWESFNCIHPSLTHSKAFGKYVLHATHSTANQNCANPLMVLQIALYGN